MPANLFAACRNREQLTARLVDLDGDIQDQVEGLFIQQMQNFYEGVDEELPFDGRWRPAANELLSIEITPEATLFRETLLGNAIAIPRLETANLATEGIKALFIGEEGNVQNGDQRVFVQRFHGGQVLNRRFPLILRGNAFDRIRDPAFILDTSLTFVIEGDLIKFRSFEKLRSILDVTDIYREATDGEVRNFAGHESFHVGDIEALLLAADQVSRKFIHAISVGGILDEYTPADIQQAAQQTELEMVLQNNRIVLPPTRRELKDLLQFLDESRFSGPLTGRPYVTNSRRLVQQP